MSAVSRGLMHLLSGGVWGGAPWTDAGSQQNFEKFIGQIKVWSILSLLVHKYLCSSATVAVHLH